MVTRRNCSGVVRKPPREIEDVVPVPVPNVTIPKKLDRGFNVSCDAHRRRQTYLIHGVKRETGLSIVEIDHG